MTNKEKYSHFCKEVYVPIYSQPWWLDAICGSESWDVWLYIKNDEVWAAMPYYMENREEYRYITKAPLTQNNGVIFKYPVGMGSIKKQAYEERIIMEACEFIKKLELDVYEQQYMYTFDNYLPFFWNGYSAIPRYTYVIDGAISLDDAWNNVSSKYRSKIKKGRRSGFLSEDISYSRFYEEHVKVFLKQGLKCPFSFELWERLYNACIEHSQGKIMVYTNDSEAILSLIFLVWDDKSVYQILGGNIPEFQNLDTYDSLIWDGISFAKERGLIYDFEGSMIKRISKSFREFGGKPKLYFRIRKVFNPEIVKMEASKKCIELQEGQHT